jgi:hypothetical protein
VYVPAILVAHHGFGSAKAYYVAMYLPHFALIVAFARRACTHVRCLEGDLPGPWTKHQRDGSSQPQNAKSLLAGMVTTGDEGEDGEDGEDDGEDGEDDDSVIVPWGRRPGDAEGPQSQSQPAVQHC